MSSKSEVALIEMPEVKKGTVGNAVPFLRNQLDLIRGVRVKVSVLLGEAELNIGRLFDLKVGDVVELDRQIGEPIELVLDGKIVARGELVAVGDSLGLRIVEIADA
jgi:flagellar motor switch protein FliN/FliY